MKSIKYPVVIAVLLCSCTNREGGSSDRTSVQESTRTGAEIGSAASVREEPIKVMDQSRAPIPLQRIEREVADLPEERFALQFTKSGFVIDNQAATCADVHRRLGELRGGTVYCEIDKFARIPNQQLEDLASVVIRSGGRFFYRQKLGAIDSLFFCFELRESPE